MKFPVRVIDACGPEIYDNDGIFIARVRDSETAQVIVDALTEQHERGQSEPSKVEDLGSTPARDISYRQIMILNAIQGVNFDLSTNISGEAVALRIRAAVTELLRLEAEKPT